MSRYTMGAHLGLHLKNERKTKFRQLRVNMAKVRKLSIQNQALIGVYILPPFKCDLKSLIYIYLLCNHKSIIK